MREINPQETTRAYAFNMWMQAPMPMVTFFKTLDVSRLVKISHKRGLKFNMLMCYCIGRAAVQVKEFYMLPVGDKLMQYDTIAVNTIVANKAGEVSSCDLPYSDDLEQFNRQLGDEYVLALRLHPKIKNFYKDEQGEYWRMYEFVPSTICLQKAESPKGTALLWSYRISYR